MAFGYFSYIGYTSDTFIPEWLTKRFIKEIVVKKSGARSPRDFWTIEGRVWRASQGNTRDH